MKFFRIMLRIFVSFTFFCYYMHNNRLFHEFRQLHSFNQIIYIMSVNRSEIFKTELFEHNARHNCIFN